MLHCQDKLVVCAAVAKTYCKTSRQRKVGSLAQSVEQLTFNQLVAGSNPARPTIISSTALIPRY